MQNRYRRNIVLTLLTLSLITVTYGQQNKTVEIDSMIHRAHRMGVFNGNILVTDHDKTIYRGAIGVSDATGKTPLTEQYRFQIGSIAKEFNAVAIMLLEQDGKLRLQDKVSRYLPELPSWADSIQIIHLLQYTSGLPDVKWATVRSDADNMADLKKLERLNATPGTQYAYNNNNVFLQRRIIEKISGMSFKQFTEKYLLQPALMRSAIIDPTPADSLIAWPFNNNKEPDPQLIPISGWVSVTLEDLFRWSGVINHFHLLTPEATRSILYPFSPGKQAGLGGGDMEKEILTRHVHDGTSRNAQALLVSDQDKGRTIILMTNNKQDNLYEFNNVIQAILDGKPYAQPKRSAYPLLRQELEKRNGEQLLSLFQQLKEMHATEYNFEDEQILNRIGYDLMSKNRIDDAIIVFDYNTKLFPGSGNVFDSLGEAYYNKGDKAKALLNYKHSLALDPANATAKTIITELEPK